MGKRRNKEPLLIEKIEIIDTANKGKAVAKYEGKVIFVQGGVPGDICDIKVFKRRKKFWEASIEKIHTYSKRRAEPKCEHFGTCGGCKWQNMKYESQLAFKQNQVLNNLKRIGGIELPENSEILGSDSEYYYRNKMEFTFSNKRWLTIEEVQSEEEIEDKEQLKETFKSTNIDVLGQYVQISAEDLNKSSKKVPNF